ncbi:MAG: hypothetical protein IGS38_19320 [Synechococcales cyanobacterium M58_A2018_015]|nr:hypothetical protein [Synechococcales cyanobacterium M58_A2018_015]
MLLRQKLIGIPATERCDDQITIPQFGMVESLNMLTAAVAIYEYLRQHSWTAT